MRFIIVRACIALSAVALCLHSPVRANAAEGTLSAHASAANPDTVTAKVALAWNASAGATSYNIYRATTSGGEGNTALVTNVTALTYTDSTVTNGSTYYYEVTAVNAYGESSKSNEATVTIPYAMATFVKTDTTTLGSWKGVYGSDGWNVAGDGSGGSPHYPSYATVSVTGHTGYTAAASTLDVRALSKGAVGAVDRVAGMWYSTTSETFDVNLTDGNTHQVALYFLDWGSNVRTQSVTIKDSTTNVTLDTRNAASFHNGIYDVWNINGHVKIVITYTGPTGYNGTVSGVFFGSTTGTTVAPVPSGVAATAGTGKVSLSWAASSGASTYNVYRATSSGGEGTTPIKTGIATTAYSDTGLTVGTKYYYRVVAVDAVGGSGGSAEVSATPVATNSATFVKTDTTTQGNWKGVYGADGWNVACDPSSNNPHLPAYATVAVSGHTGYTMAASTTDVRALQKAAVSSTDRIAGMWYTSTTETFDITINDGNAHQIAFYFLDWGSNMRSETVTIKDAVSGATLDTRPVSSFHNGIYNVWSITGHVKLVITNTGPTGYNAETSGFFFK